LYGQQNLAGPIGYCKKFRPKPNAAVITLPKKFNVRGKNIILVDDMIDTAGTLVGAADALHKAGARAIYAAAVHGVLSDPAISRIKKSPINKVIITNTFPIPKEKKISKIKIISVAPILKKIIF
jgi:ribose-phosphate pyrophosphokinase